MRFQSLRWIHFLPAVTALIPNTGARKKLPPGIIRNRVGTWVTNEAGLTAFYVRRAAHVGSFDFDSCGESPPAYPDHSSFASTLNEDEYSLKSCPCTGSFSFTRHPNDYESVGPKDDSNSHKDDYDSDNGVPVSSVSVRCHPSTHAQEMSEAWLSDPDGPVPPRCAALISLATSVDDAIDHITDMYGRQDHLHDRLAGLRATMSAHNGQLMDTVASLRVLSETLAPRSDSDIAQTVSVHVSPLQQSVTDMDLRLQAFITSVGLRLDALGASISDHRDSMALLSTQYQGLDARLTEHQGLIDSEFVTMDARLTTLASSTPGTVSLSKSARASLSALEKSAKQRLTDHATKLAHGLRRKHEVTTPAAKQAAESREKGDCAWSVASDSQLSQDAPGDHDGVPRRSPTDGESPPAPSPEDTSNGDTPQPGPRPPTSFQSPTPTPLQYAPRSHDRPNPVQNSRSTRFPTPWADNSFYARDNPPSQGDRHQCLPDSSSADAAPAEICMLGCTYTRVDPSSARPPPLPHHHHQSELMTASAQLVSPSGKVWHGGGSATSFLQGVETLTQEAVLALGVPVGMAHIVIAAHSQVYTVWNKQPMGYGYTDSSTYRAHNHPHGRISSHLQNDALKYTGWTELPPSSTITPEKWVEFYTSLQLTAAQFGLGLMPFDALELQYAQGGHAFSLCGLGYRVFTQMGSSLFLVVQKLLPLTDPHISSKMQSVAQNGGNGFELLWILTKHFVPMVSVTRQLTWPVWPSTDDVFLFARRVGLYCTLPLMWVYTAHFPA